MKTIEKPVSLIRSLPDEQPVKTPRGWALKVVFETVDGEAYTMNETFRLKRDAVAFKMAHADGRTPRWRTDVILIDGAPWGWTEHIGLHQTVA